MKLKKPMFTDKSYDLSKLNKEQMQFMYKDNKDRMFMSFSQFKMMSETCLFTFDCTENGCYPTFRDKRYIKGDIINAVELF